MVMTTWTLLLTLWATQPAGTRRQVYVSPDGVFQFSYSSEFILNTKANADEEGVSYFPVCADPTVCVVSRRNYFSGTNFQAASFAEREITDATSKLACLKGPADGIPRYPLPESDQTRVISGLTFGHWLSGEVGAGNGSTTDFYRVFHGHKCYELSLVIAESSFGNFDPGTKKEFTRDDERRVMRDLMVSLNSFRFLK